MCLHKLGLLNTAIHDNRTVEYDKLVGSAFSIKAVFDHLQALIKVSSLINTYLELTKDYLQGNQAECVLLDQQHWAIIA